jgi:hypothetical protein
MTHRGVPLDKLDQPPRLTIGSYTFERIPRADHGPGSHGRWGCSWRNKIGVGNCRTPFGAFVKLRLFLRASALL